MPQAVITINAVVGSDDDLPIGTIVQLNNQNSGGESTYLWEIVSQPAGTADVLSSTSLQNPTFTPNKEGTYLIRLTVNQSLPTERQDQVIAAVRQLKTRLRIPAVGETDENGTDGWAEPASADAALQLVDTMRADPGIEVCVIDDVAVIVGTVVRYGSTVTIKSGLPGQEDLLGVYQATALSPITEPLGYVVGTVTMDAPGVGSLVYVRRFGLQDVGVVVGAVVGQPAYLDDTAHVSDTAGTNSRKVGVFVAAGASAVVYFDGSQQESGGGGSDVLWEWNETDTSQFDGTPVTSAGQTAILTTSPIDLNTNKAFSTLDLTAAWSGAGGAVAFRVSDALTLPERFRLRVGLSAVPAGIRIGVMFYDDATWGAGLVGGGMTYGSTFLRWLIAYGAAAGYPPFDLPGVTSSWGNPGTLDDYNGMLNEWDCTLRPGAGGKPPAVALYGRNQGYYNGTNAYTITVDRGQLIGDGTVGGLVNAAFNNASLTKLAIVAQSTAIGGYTASFNKLQILTAL